jgi:hypothetical protein
MTPAPPVSVIVNVYLPLLSLSLGYVEVAGLWGAPASVPSAGWAPLRAPRASWHAVPRPVLEAWKVEKP